MSLAYMVCLMPYMLASLLDSPIMQILKSTGEITDPWGVPRCPSGTYPETKLPMRSLALLQDRNDLMQLYNLGPSLRFGTVSKINC